MDVGWLRAASRHREQALGPPWSALLGLRAWSTSRDRLKASLGVGGSPEPGLAGLSAQPLAPAALVLIAPSLDGDFVTASVCLFGWAWRLSPNRPCPDFSLHFVKSHLFTMTLSVPLIFHFQKI